MSGYLHHSDARIRVDYDADGMVVTLWAVRGISGRLYPTRVAAELALRDSFPEEGFDGYARIYSMTFTREME